MVEQPENQNTTDVTDPVLEVVNTTTTDGADESTTDRKNKRAPLLPQTDVDILTVAKNALEVWRQEPEYRIKWKTPDDFAADIIGFEDALNAQANTSARRSPYSSDMTQLNKEIDSHLIFVKDMLKNKFGKDTYISYFQRFGITHDKKMYILPRDQQERKIALSRLLDSMIELGLDDPNHGIECWRGYKEEFDRLSELIMKSTTTVSKFTGNKNTYKTELRRTLEALSTLIRINNPDTYETELRAWGFLREKH